MAAATQVLHIYELVERMFPHLPLIDLLLAQRVCKTWSSISQRSQNIQRALFKIPYSDTVARIDLVNDYGPGFWRDTQNDRTLREPLLNPLLSRYVYDGGDGKAVLAHHGLVAPTSSDGKEGKVDDKILALHRRNASWKNMLMVQPPAINIAFYCREGNTGNSPDPDTYEVVNANGVRLGGAINGLRQHWFGCPNCPYDEDEGDVPYWWTRVMMQLNFVSRALSGWELLAQLSELYGAGSGKAV